MKAKELREALEKWRLLDDAYDSWELGEGTREQWGEAYLKAEDSLHLLEDAARQRLAQLEGDEGLVGRIADTLGYLWLTDPEPMHFKSQARAILAALITTDSQETE